MVVLFQRVALNRRTINQVLHHSIVWKTPECGYMFAVSWSLTKGDYWKDKNEEIAKFFSCNWRKKSGGFIRTGIYVGRLAIVWQTRPEAIDIDRNTQRQRKPYKV